MFVCVLLGVFPEFLVHPYYEPLLWFMIIVQLLYWNSYIHHCEMKLLVCLITNNSKILLFAGSIYNEQVTLVRQLPGLPGYFQNVQNVISYIFTMIVSKHLLKYHNWSPLYYLNLEYQRNRILYYNL